MLSLIHAPGLPGGLPRWSLLRRQTMHLESSGHSSALSSSCFSYQGLSPATPTSQGRWEQLLGTVFLQRETSSSHPQRDAIKQERPSFPLPGFPELSSGGQRFLWGEVRWDGVGLCICLFSLEGSYPASCLSPLGMLLGTFSSF